MFRLSLITLSLLSAGAMAQDKPLQKDEHEIEKLVITASPLSKSVLESATPVSIISGEELKNNVAPTLGETLKTVPGVHSNYFGPVSSSPVIRGLDGPRIKVVQNGLDVSDASRVGPDHIVSTETANATQIEVLRGPATLLYGSGAIGGVVNVVDNRLPQEARTTTSGTAMYLHDTVSDENLVSLSADGGVKGFSWHVDGFDRSTNNYKLPDGVHAEEHHDEEHEEEHDEMLERLDNSFIDANGFTLGSAFIGDNFRAALSYGSLKSDYGIPGHAHGEEHEEEHEGEHEEEHGHEEELTVAGRLDQDRYQGVVDWFNLEGFFSELHWHTAYTDYTHAEIENGEIGTEFFNETLETRLWAKHRSLNGWEGVLGFSYNDNDFSAFGEEAFTPPSTTESAAVFLLEEKRVGDLLWQLGARVERVEIEPQHEGEEEHHDEEHEEHVEAEALDFTATSLSAGVVWSIDNNQSLAFNLARSERAPSAAELYSNGPHIGTNTYEVGAFFDVVAEGDEFEIVASASKIEKEVANNVDITYRHRTDHTNFALSLFYNEVDNYIFQQDTGFDSDAVHGHDEHEEEGHSEEIHGAHEEVSLPVFLFRQQDAELYGFEVEFDWHLTDNLRLDSFADYTRAKLDNGENVPRMPPLRVSSALHYETSDYHLELGATHYASQDKLAPGETETSSYTLVNFAFNYYLDAGNNEWVVFVKGNNLTDKLARVHQSFLKDDAPLPGRSIVFGTRFNF